MPTIPTQPGPGVSPIPDQTPFQNIQFQNTAEPLGAAVSDLAKELAISNEEDERARAKELDVLYRERLRELTFGGPDGPGGYLSTQGRAAVKEFGNYQTAAEKAREEIANQAENPNIRRFFMNSSGTHLQNQLEVADRHRFKNNEIAKVAASAARVEAIGDTGIANYSVPSMVFDSARLINGEIITEGTRLSKDEKAIQVERDNALSDYYLGVISRAVEDPSGSTLAREYFNNDNIKKFLEKKPENFLAAKQLIDDAEQIFQANAIVGEILGSLGGIPTITEGLNMARRSVSDPELLSLVERKLRLDIQAIRQDQDRVRQEVLDANIVAAQEGAGNPNFDIDHFIGQDPNLRDLPGGPDLVRKAYKNEKLGQRFAVVSEKGRLEAIQRMPYNQVLNLNPDAERVRLDPTDYGSYLQIRAAATASLRDDAVSRAAFAERQQAIRETAPEGINFDKLDKNEDNRRLVLNAERSLDIWAEQFRLRNQSTPTPQELRDEARNIWLKVEEDIEIGGITIPFFKSETTGAEVRSRILRETPELAGTYAPSIDSISDEALEDARNGFAQLGIFNVPDSVLEQFIGASIMQDTARKRRIVQTLLRGRENAAQNN